MLFTSIEWMFYLFLVFFSLIYLWNTRTKLSAILFAAAVGSHINLIGFIFLWNMIFGGMVAYKIFLCSMLVHQLAYVIGTVCILVLFINDRREIKKAGANLH